MAGRLAGKVAIITGAARGMGAATARLFAAEGASVVLIDVLGELVAGVAQSIGANAAAIRGDVREESDWNTAIGTAVQKFGGVDVLVNNAGILIPAAIENVRKADVQDMFNVNALGPLLGMRMVVPEMKRRGRGSIVNISSVSGLQGGNGVVGYTASKYALHGITKVAALELGHYKIRVNSIHPGPIDTPMGNPTGAPRATLDPHAVAVPLRRVGGPEEVAQASLFLASDDASYVSGAEVTVDGGWSAGDYEPALPGMPPR